MLKEHIKAYIENQTARLTAHLEVAGQPQSTDAVHDARVCIKRIRAFLKVFDIRKRNKRIRKLLNKELDTIFKAAGVLRDTEIQVNLLKDYEKILDQSFPGLEKKLIEKIEKRRKNLREIVADRQPDLLLQLQHEITGETDALSDENIIKSVKDYLIQAVQKNERNRHLINPKVLHKQRILLKEIRFCCEMTADVIPELDTAERIPMIKEMEDLLGSWHDYNILNKSIERYRKKLKKPETDKTGNINLLAHTITNDIILLLDKYNKTIPNPVLRSFRL